MNKLETQSARASGELPIAGDLLVVRLGYGSMLRGVDDGGSGACDHS